MNPKLTIDATVRLNAYAVISRAVEEGVRCGYRRAHKHTATPDEETVCNEMETAVMNALSEILKYEENPS